MKLSIYKIYKIYKIYNLSFLIFNFFPMYFPYFIAYIAVGLLLGFSVFFWALKNGQFQDQQRARFLPLRDQDPLAPPAVSRMRRIEIYALFFLATAGLAASGALLAFALYFSK